MSLPTHIRHLFKGPEDAKLNSIVLNWALPDHLGVRTVIASDGGCPDGTYRIVHSVIDSRSERKLASHTVYVSEVGIEDLDACSVPLPEVLKAAIDVRNQPENEDDLASVLRAIKEGFNTPEKIIAFGGPRFTKNRLYMIFAILKERGLI